MADTIRNCLRCGGEMKLLRKGNVLMRPDPFALVEEWVYMELYVCPDCRCAEWIAPMTPVEEFEAEQKAKENMTPVEKFEYTFRDYTEKQLQKVINGRDYVDDAKKAAQNLLNKRKHGDTE